MRSNIKPENRRLLEALCYIDEEVLAEVLAEVTVPESSKPVPRKKVVIRSIKYAALLAACALLVGAVFPIVSYIMGIIDLNPGSVTISESTDSSKVIRTGYQVFGDEVYFDRIGYLTRYQHKTGEMYDLSGKYEGFPVKVLNCISQIVDGKLYYIYENAAVSSSKRPIYAAALDLLTMKSVDLCRVSSFDLMDRAYVYGQHYYYSTAAGVYRVSITGGEPILVMEFDTEDSLFMVAEAELITVNQASDVSAPSDPDRSIIKAYDLITKTERILWNGEENDCDRVISPSYLNGKLYFLARAAQGYDLISIEISSGKSECIKSSIASYWLMNDGIFYYPYELRHVDYISPFAAAPENYATEESATLRYCNLEGKNDRRIYKNENITSFYPSKQVIANGKMIGFFCGTFPELGRGSTCILAEIDLETGKIRELQLAQNVIKSAVSEEELADINAAWAAKKGDGSIFVESRTLLGLWSDKMCAVEYGDCVLARFGESIVICRHTANTTKITREIIGEHQLWFGHVCEIWVCHKAKYYTVTEAYENNILTKDNIAELEARQRVHNKVYTLDDYVREDYQYLEYMPGLEPLDDSYMGRIDRAFIQHKYDSAFDWSLKQYANKSRGEAEFMAERESDGELILNRNKLFSDKYEYYRYYGIVNGYVVFTIADGSYPINTHYLAGHTMYFKYPSSIYIYADGEFMLMSNAYSDGILSSEDIGEIARRHWLYNDYLGLPNVKPEITVEKTQPKYLEFEGLEPLTEDEMHTIREALAKYLYDNDYDNKYRLYLSSYGAEIAELFAKELLEGAYEQYRENLFNEDNYYYYGYLGKFGDSVVLLRRSSIGPVAQYKFEGKEYWVQSPGINIYNNGEIIGLNDAYEKGLLNIDQIDEIFNVRIKRYNDKIF